MKRRYLLTPLFAGAVALTACKDKPKTTAPNQSTSPSASADELVAPEADLIKAVASPAARAAKLGFAKHLPKDMVHFEAIYNGRKAFDRFLQTGMGEFLLERMAEDGFSMDDAMESDEFVTQVASYSEEYFAAYGKGTGEGFDQGVQLLERMLYYGARTGVFAADSSIRDGGDFDPESPKVLLDGPLKGASKELIQLLANFNMPAFYQGAKISDEEVRELVLEQQAEMISTLGMIDGAFEPISFERSGSEFSGYKLNGQALSDMIDDETVEALQEVFDIADIDAFKKAIEKQKLIVVSGEVDNYALLFVGQSEKDFVLVDQVKDSICANEKMVFVDPYLEKNLFTAGFSDVKVLKTVGSFGVLGNRLMGALTDGLNDGLGAASSLGDTQDVEALLQSLKKQGDQIAALSTFSDMGIVSYFEDGIKFETYGGSNMPSLDVAKTNKFSPLANGEGTLLFANWTEDENYNQKLLDYIDTLGETTYMMTKHVSSLDIDDRDFDEFKQGFGMFDEGFRKDALELWQAMHVDLASGLGAESALVIDLNGSLPKIPDVPRPLIKEAKIPRIAYVSSVTDRDKLKSSWTRVNGAAESILEKVSEMAETEIPMQDMISSDKNGLTTWWTSIPFTGNDFLPCVSVSDDLFFASTSKTFSESLSDSYKSEKGIARKGAWMRVDFNVLNQYASDWFTLLEKNADEVIPSESAREDFQANKEMINKALKAFETVEEMTMHARNEGGQSRISFHLKAK